MFLRGIYYFGGFSINILKEMILLDVYFKRNRKSEVTYLTKIVLHKIM